MDFYNLLAGRSNADKQTVLIQSVCHGYLRRHLTTIRIDDIATIIYQYIRIRPFSFIHHKEMSSVNPMYNPNIFNDCILNCKFQLQSKRYGYKECYTHTSTVLLTPFLSQMLLSNPNHSNLTFNFCLCVPEMHVPQPGIDDKFSRLAKIFDLNNWEKGGAYEFQCGLIEIPKEAFVLFPDSNVDQFNIKLNGLSKFKQYLTSKAVGFENVLSGQLHRFLNINFYHAINNKNKTKRCKGYFMSFGYQNGMHSVYYNSTKKIYLSFTYNPKFCLAVNDSVQLCVEYKIKNQCNMSDNVCNEKIQAKFCFKMRNQVLKNEQQQQQQTFFDLDFNNNYYFVALSNMVAAPAEKCTYTFQVSRWSS